MVSTNIRLIILYAARDGEALYSQQKQDRELTVAELLIAKFRLKLKKVGKTTRPFRYDLNQIPNDYTVELRNKFKVHCDITFTYKTGKIKSLRIYSPGEAVGPSTFTYCLCECK